MKKLNLQLDSIKEMLTKEQMKKIVGGYGEGGGGYIVETTCTITENGHQYVCWCALASDGDWRYGLCRSIDNIA